MVGSTCITWLATSTLCRNSDVDKTARFLSDSGVRVINGCRLVGLALVGSALWCGGVGERGGSIDGDTGSVAATAVQAIATVVAVTMAGYCVVRGRVRVARARWETNPGLWVNAKVTGSVAVGAVAVGGLFDQTELVCERLVWNRLEYLRG